MPPIRAKPGAGPCTDFFEVIKAEIVLAGSGWQGENHDGCEANDKMKDIFNDIFRD